jgi:hypothetical protein
MITQQQVKTAIAAGKPTKIGDGRGVYLWVRGPGRAIWLYQIRQGAKTTSRKLGDAADMTPTDARKARDAYAVAVASGTAPEPQRTTRAALAAGRGTTGAPDREDARPSAAWPLSQALAYYLRIHSAEWTPRTGRELARLAETYCKAIASKPVGTVTLHDIADTIAPILDEGEPRSRRALALASRMDVHGL